MQYDKEVFFTKDGLEVVVDAEVLRFTDSLLRQIKALFGGRVFEGRTPQQKADVRHMWCLVVASLGKEVTVRTLRELFTNPDCDKGIAPSAIEFKRMGLVFKQKNKPCKGELIKAIPFTITEDERLKRKEKAAVYIREIKDKLKIN